MVLSVIDSLHGEVLMHHLCQCLGDLILITLVHRFIPLISIRCGDLDPAVTDRRSLCGKSIAGTCLGKLADSADISCVQLRYLHRLASFEYVKLVQLLLCILIDVI